MFLREVLPAKNDTPRFCAINTPETVPIKPVIAAKISLFHLPRKAMWAKEMRFAKLSWVLCKRWNEEFKLFSEIPFEE